MFCTKCGASNAIDSAFCAKCGHKLEQELQDSGHTSLINLKNNSQSLSPIKNYVSRPLETFPSKMNGKLELQYEVCKVLAERQELSVSSSGKAETNFHGETYFAFEVESSTDYQYWVKWESGKEELIRVPVECRPGQTLVLIFAHRVKIAEDEKWAGINAKFNGVIKNYPFFQREENFMGPKAPFSHVYTLNLETRVKHSKVREYATHHLHPVAKDFYKQPELKFFGFKLFKSLEELYSNATKLIDEAIVETEQFVDSFAEKAVLSLRS